MEWKKVRSEDIYNIFSSPNIFRAVKSRRMVRVLHVARMGELRNVYIIFVGKSERKKLLGGLERKWKGSIKLDLI
jgi:hypothetical protein